MQKIPVIVALITSCFTPQSATADLMALPSRVYCGSTAELESNLKGFIKTHEGLSGNKGDGLYSELWVKKATGDYFIVQRIESEKRSCVVLGGNGFQKFIEGKSL